MFTEAQISYIAWALPLVLFIFAFAAIIYAVGKLLSGISWIWIGQSTKKFMDTPVTEIPEITEDPIAELDEWLEEHNGITWLIDEDLRADGICAIDESFLRRIARSAPLIPEEEVEDLYEALQLQYENKADGVSVELITMPEINGWQIVVKYVMPEP